MRSFTEKRIVLKILIPNNFSYIFSYLKYGDLVNFNNIGPVDVVLFKNPHNGKLYT